MHPLEVLTHPGFNILRWWKTACGILVLLYGPDMNEVHPDFILIRVRVVT